MAESSPKKRPWEWEWRVFWPEACPLSAELARFSFVRDEPRKIVEEENSDVYLFIKDSPQNIKLRDGEIAYKWLVEIKDQLYGYTKKKSTEFPLSPCGTSFIPSINIERQVDDITALARLLEQTGHRAEITTIDKQRRTAKLRRAGGEDEEMRKAKAEFATIRLLGRSFQTLSLESRHRKWLLEMIPLIDTKGGYVMDYKDFIPLVAAGRI